VKTCYERWCDLRREESYQSLEIDPLTSTIKFEEKGKNIVFVFLRERNHFLNRISNTKIRNFLIFVFEQNVQPIQKLEFS